MNLTSQQRFAIETHHQNLIVVAGAGSGKTRVLVERYLALLDANVHWPINALVAITFTKKAAGEMRDRVRQSLEGRLRDASTDEKKMRWSNLLQTMDSARIDTIHGLCATILRANAAEAGIDPNFAVLDETDAVILLNDVIEDTLQRLVVENDPALALITEHKYELKALRDVLAQPELLAAEVPDNLIDLFAAWEAQWSEFALDCMRGFLYEAETIGTWEPAFHSDSLADNWHICLECLDIIYRQPSFDDRLAALIRISEFNMKGGSVKNWGGKDAFDAAKASLTKIRNTAKKRLEMIGSRPNERDRRAAEIIPLWNSLLRSVQQAYTKAKLAASYLDFNDLEFLTAKLLTENADVRARYCGTEFRHILVDEFQDTNSAQWRIICALAALETPGSLFVVGDPKQSIYQFRGADVSVFGSVQAQITESGGKAVPLAESFRTHRPLVDCFNFLFGKLLVQDESSPVKHFEVTLGEPMSAFRANAPNPLPFLELILLDKDSGGDKAISMYEGRRWEAYEIAQRLHEMVESQTIIFDKELGEHRPMGYGDAALLFQATSNITLYEDVFKALNLPFVTIAGRGYYSRQEVWDLLNLLKALDNPADNLSLATVLRSPLFNLSDDALFALRLTKDENGKPLSLWEALNQPAYLPLDEIHTVAFARDTLRELYKIAGRVTISELLRDALARTGYLATLTGLPDGARRRGNVEKLLEKAQSSGRITLGAFSQYLSDLSKREVREGEALLEAQGAVTLMTVHASKGLEFPVVGLVDSSWSKRGGGSDTVLYDAQYGLTCKVYDEIEQKLAAPFSFRFIEHLSSLRETAERKRLLYVAATRAQDYLLVSGQVSTKKEAHWKTDGWLDWLCDGLSLFADERPPYGVATVLDRQWGQVRLTMPASPPTADMLMPDERKMASAWDFLIDSPSGEIQAPLLVKPVTVQRSALARHLAATQIADLGSANHASPSERYLYRDRFRRSVLHDAPAHIPSIIAGEEKVTGRQIGEIVHEALRHWRFPTEDNDLDDVLESYAWKHGIVNDAYRASAVREAHKLLNGMVNTDVYRWVNASKDAKLPVFTELPFIYRTDKRIIHGVLDMLFQREDGTWVIVDYKTSYISKARIIPAEDIAKHAERYHLQIGIYAAAVQNQLGGLVPETYIHYIRYTQTVKIEHSVWQAALGNLEGLIGSMVWDDEETL